MKKLELDANSDACEQFVRQMMPRLDYKVFRTASEAVEPALSSKLPADLPQEWEKDSEFMKNVSINSKKQFLKIQVYSLLVGYEVVEGELECPETQRVFPITEGIPNMLVRAEEVAES